MSTCALYLFVMANFVHPAKEDITLYGILSALSDPFRVKILKCIMDNGGVSCSKASPCPKIAKSTLSRHFRLLREAGLIRTSKSGVENNSTSRIDEVNEKFPGLVETILKFYNENDHTF